MKINKLIKIILIINITLITIITSIYILARIYPKLDIKNVNTFYLYDNNNELYFKGSGSKEWVSLDNINESLIKSTIHIEDKKFYNHHGFDILRIIKSLLSNITQNKIVSGASTITQQYSKNLYLNFDKTLKRKLYELWYTIRIETHYSKNEILEGYLNTINYGHGMYGIENASRFYFNKSSSDLTLAESTILVNIPKSPNTYSPINNYEKAKKRQEYVLNKLLKDKVITKDEYEKAINEKIEIYGKKENNNSKTIMYYQDAVFKELKDIKSIPDTYFKTGGLKIYTNLDINAQKLLEDNINKIILNDDLEVNSIMTIPDSGKIIALIGGRDYNKSQFNRATSSYRQVGSTMKPILYYAALENGFTASSCFTSEKTSFYIGDNNYYSPKNYNNTYANKSISMASAISYSDNIYAIKTHLFLGEQELIKYAYKMGIKTKLEPIISLPLGTKELNILEITSVYQTLANEGIYNQPYLIEKVTDINENVLYEHKKEDKNVLDKSLVYILNDLLTTTYDSNMIDYNYPTTISIKPMLTNKYAIKSGSTLTDNWIIGFNKNALTSIWVGYDNNNELLSEDYTYIKKIWAKTMESYLKDKDNSWYKKPNNVVGVIVNPINGQIDNSKKKKILYYIKGSEPSIIE